MLVVTTNDVAGAQVRQVLGQAFGVVVRSRGLGGKIHEYTAMLEEARRHALDRLVQNATLMGANAVIAMRFDSSEIGETMSEIVAYGTAVVLADGAAPAAGAGTAASANAASSSVVPPTFGHRHAP